MRGKGADRAATFAIFTRDGFRLADACHFGRDQVATVGDRKLHGFAQIDVRPGESPARWRW